MRPCHVALTRSGCILPITFIRFKINSYNKDHNALILYIAEQVKTITLMKLKVSSDIKNLTDKRTRIDKEKLLGTALVY